MQSARVVRLSFCTLVVSLEKRLGVGGELLLFSLGPRMNMCERSLSLICSLQPLQPIHKSKSEGQGCRCMSEFCLQHCVASQQSAVSPCPTRPNSCFFSFLIQGPSATGLLHTQLPLPTPQHPNGLLLHFLQISIQYHLAKIFQSLCLNFPLTLCLGLFFSTVLHNTTDMLNIYLFFSQ